MVKIIKENKFSDYCKKHNLDEDEIYIYCSDHGMNPEDYCDKNNIPYDLSDFYDDEYDEMPQGPQRFTFIIKRYHEEPEEEIIIANSEEEAEDKMNHDEYIEWWDYYNPSKVY